MAGWGHNDELWTVLRSGPDGSAGGLRQLVSWLDDLPQASRCPPMQRICCVRPAIRLTTLPAVTGSAQVLHNLRQGLLSQLPRGPVQELCLYAPFVDQTGEGPRRGHRLVRPRPRGHRTAGALDQLRRRCRAARGRATARSRYGSCPNGSPARQAAGMGQAGNGPACPHRQRQPHRSALIRPPPARELRARRAYPGRGVADAQGHLRHHRDELQGRRTVSEIARRPAVLLLGALLTRAGLVVTLARAYDVDVTIETSPDGSPGSWTTDRRPSGRPEQKRCSRYRGGRARRYEPSRPQARARPRRITTCVHR